MQALLNTVLPVALVVLAGYLLGKRIPMDLTTLSRLTLYLLVPALIFDAMYRAEYSREGLWGLTLGFSLTEKGGVGGHNAPDLQSGDTWTSTFAEGSWETGNHKR